ncbi:MAG: DNA mismatch repair protein MutS [Chitinophagaceae bacterium]|jgi:DNA mismatch repair ATPase MutS|nr:DNA mismatch repair protein MutS [Chitinophagaceae bacterium]
MQIDNITLNDLSIFNRDEHLSVFHHFNFARTSDGKDYLRKILASPLQNIEQIKEMQALLQRYIEVLPQWSETISNGTIMVIDKFYQSIINTIPYPVSRLSGISYKFFSSSDYGIVRFTVKQTTNLIYGMKQIIDLFSGKPNPKPLQKILDRIEQLLNRPLIKQISQYPVNKTLSLTETLNVGHLLQQYKQGIKELLDIYGNLDAWYSLAMACVHYKLIFPEITASDSPEIKAVQLYHPLLPTPVANDVALDNRQNFLFLTGANMGGKSTFIKAVGIAAYLAHLGMGVPAKAMQISFLDGLVSNIQVTDNILLGESYFYNEVQRVKKAIEKINDGKKWLVLIDELFKGTNVLDAMKCSTVVIEGLRKIPNSLFVLSTHLYEIGEKLKQHPNIQFRYFEIDTSNDDLQFSYQLNEGISNDRIGYLILKREGVVDMLNKL